MTTAVEFQSGWLLQEIDHLHDEGLLIQRIRVAGMPVLIARSLEI